MSPEYCWRAKFLATLVVLFALPRLSLLFAPLGSSRSHRWSIVSCGRCLPRIDYFHWWWWRHSWWWSIALPRCHFPEYLQYKSPVLQPWHLPVGVCWTIVQLCHSVDESVQSVGVLRRWWGDDATTTMSFVRFVFATGLKTPCWWWGDRFVARGFYTVRLLRRLLWPSLLSLHISFEPADSWPGHKTCQCALPLCSIYKKRSVPFLHWPTILRSSSSN